MSRTQISTPPWMGVSFGRPCRRQQGRFARQTRQHPRSTVAPPGGMRRNLLGAENLLRHSPSPLAKAALIVLRNRRSFRCVSLSRNPRRKFVAGEQEATKMPNCPKCEKPVYFAERKFSLGKDWHSACLRCEKCNKTLAPGSHAEHEGKPYCHQPCYSALYGPGGYGRGGAESYVYKK